MFERFRIYNFGFEYPKGATISFGKGSSRSKGHVIFHLPAEERIFISWGQLDSIPEKLGTPEAHAAYSLSKLSKAMDLRKVRLITKVAVNINGHTAVLTHVAIDSAGAFSTNRNREIRALHLHCVDSGRFFILNESCIAGSTVDSQVFAKLRESFVCH
jgi:hypothetical protein